MVAKIIYALVLLGLISDFKVEGLSGKWTALGCYKDDTSRALEKFLGLAKHTDSYLNLFRDCKQLAESGGYKFFGVQHEKECWGSNRTSYDRHGCSQNCETSGEYGMGKDWANYVYYDKDQWTSCDCVEKIQYKIKLPKDDGLDCPSYNRRYTVSDISKVCSIDNCVKVDGNWTDYGPWTACDKLCGEEGTQKRIRTCTNPAPSGGGKYCVGSSEIVRSCNATNCPDPCSFDGLTVQLLGFLGSSITVNNHMVSALTQVVQAIDRTVSIAYPYGYEHEQIRRIKASLLHPGGEEAARRFFAALLSVQKNCNYKRAIKDLKHKIGWHSLKRLVNADGVVSLIFTMDIAGSVKPFIDQAKVIVKSIAARKSKVNYILSTFGEPIPYNPEVKVKFFYKAKQFLKALDKIKPYTSWDCPEPTYAGIIKAISQGHPTPGSPMYVFTDAPPKEVGRFTRQEAIRYALRSNIKVNFFLTDGTGVCSHQTPQPKDSQDFKEIIKATGGVGLSFHNASFIGKLKNVVKADLEGSQILSSSSSCKEVTDDMFGKRSYSKFLFPVDDIAKTLSVFVSGTNVGEGVTLTDSKGAQWSAEISRSDSKIWVILEPHAGEWSLRVASIVSNFNHEVKSSAALGISFTPTFKKSGSVIPHPLKGDQANVKLDIPNLSRLDTDSLKFHIIGENEKQLSKSGELYTSQLPPGDTLKLRMSGKTLSGVGFERLSISFMAKNGVLRPVTSLRTLTEDEDTSFTIAVHYTGSGSKTFSLSAKSSSSEVPVRPSKSSVTVSSGGSADVSFSLTAPSGLDSVAVTFQAKSDDLLLSLPIDFDVEGGW